MPIVEAWMMPFVSFESMSIRDTQVWSAMIVGYATQGQVQKAISMFREIMRAKMQPNE